MNTGQTWTHQSCRNGNSKSPAFSKTLWRRFKGSGWTKGEPLFQWQTPPPLTPTSLLSLLSPLLVLILWDVSAAHVCECQWEAALWLFYELHYWFPILLRTENVIMHRPRPNPLHPRQTHLRLSLPSFSFLSFTLWLFINLSFAPAFSNLPPPRHHLTSLKLLSGLSFNNAMTAMAFANCSAAASAVPHCKKPFPSQQVIWWVAQSQNVIFVSYHLLRRETKSFQSIKFKSGKQNDFCLVTYAQNQSDICMLTWSVAPRNSQALFLTTKTRHCRHWS